MKDLKHIQYIVIDVDGTMTDAEFIMTNTGMN